MDPDQTSDPAAPRGGAEGVALALARRW
jgi:hypothetical protein